MDKIFGNLAVSAVLFVSLAIPVAATADDHELIAALRSGGHVAIMRHAIAPGSDDPLNFRIGDCATQRNLSDGGRAQAVAIGERLRDGGIARARVASSQWCRCVDTARLLELGEVEELPFLNSLLNYPGRSSEMTQDLRAWILEQDLGEPTILVTHQVNIRQLLRTPAEEGEILVVRVGEAGELSHIGSIAPWPSRIGNKFLNPG